MITEMFTAMFKDFFIVLAIIIAGTFLLIQLYKMVPPDSSDTDTQTAPPQLTDILTAQAIWQEINLAQFQHMLTALQSALKQSGYQLTLHGNGVKMHPHREEQVADSLMSARELYWAPNQSTDEIEQLVMSCLLYTSPSPRD